MSREIAEGLAATTDHSHSWFGAGFAGPPRRSPSAGTAPEAVVAAAAVLSVLAAGCATLDARFGPVGYHDNVYGLFVRYVDAPRYDLMGADWRLDNFVLNDHGLPTAVKATDEYTTELEFDVDGDGEDDREGTFRLYVLRFEHRRDPGVIWLRTFPVSDRLAERELPALADDYVQEVAGGSYFAVRLAGRPMVQDVRLATVVIEEGETRVDETPAWQVTFDVANVDQLRLDPNSRSSRVRVVLLRPPFTYPVRARGHDMVEYTTLMVLGYANSPDYFDAHVGEFQDFLDRIRLEQSE
ncbi:MAG: hypothetical protein HY905_22685 [Deltaproteobacteria bacterium]|nr:hypothetical protein [Deltaproteobacteria bacterium]